MPVLHCCHLWPSVHCANALSMLNSHSHCMRRDQQCGSSSRAEFRFAVRSLNPQPACVNYLNEFKKRPTAHKSAVFPWSVNLNRHTSVVLLYLSFSNSLRTSNWLRAPLANLLHQTGENKKKSNIITYSLAVGPLVRVQGSSGSRRRSGRTSAAPPLTTRDCLTRAPRRSECQGPGKGRRRASWGRYPGAGWWCRWWTPSCCPAPPPSAC